jgi:hypothetical protein
MGRYWRFGAPRVRGGCQVFDVVDGCKVVPEPHAVRTMGEVRYLLDDLSDGELFCAGVPEALIPAVRAVRTDDAFEQLADYLPKEASQSCPVS